MPRPLPVELRARVMALLEAGTSVTEIARRLQISRMTVYRYRQAAQQQQREVPQPRPAGGYRHSKLRRREIRALATLALQHPKDTLEELRDRALSTGILSVPVSRTTVWRALHKAGVTHKRATFFDPKTHTEPGIAYERRVFRRAQKQDPLFDPKRLLFYDETLVYLNEQQRRAWGTRDASARLPRPKGQTLSTAIFLTIGQGGILHYKIYPPARPFQPLPARYQASELREPGKGTHVGLCEHTIKHTATARQLRELLQQHHIKRSDAQGKSLTKPALIDTVLQLKRTGLVGLLRATRGRKDQGGAPVAFRASTRDVVQYWLEFQEWAEEQKLDVSDRSVLWDNAPTHSPVRTTQTQRISVFHRWFREWGFRGAIFTPPRSPSFNPVELANAYLKRWIRKWAPEEGYTQQGLEGAIHRAIAKITPAFVENWITGCGYVLGAYAEREDDHQDPRGPAEAHEDHNNAEDAEDSKNSTVPVDSDRAVNPCDRKEPLPKRPHCICLDAQGTWVREKRPGETRWRAGSTTGQAENVVPQRPTRMPQGNNIQTLSCHQARWAGYNPAAPPVGVAETKPPGVAVLGDDIFAPEHIVDERMSTCGRREFRIRWKGFGHNEDTWEPEANLLVGAQLLLRTGGRPGSGSSRLVGCQVAQRPLPTEFFKRSRNEAEPANKLGSGLAEGSGTLLRHMIRALLAS